MAAVARLISTAHRHGPCCRRLSTAGFALNRSAGVIFDPYQYISPEEMPSSFSPEGIQRNLSVAKSVAQSSYSAAFITRHVPSFAARTFPAQADDLYTAFIDGHREGNVNALRSVVTDGLLEGLRRELQAAGGGQAQQPKHRHNRKGGKKRQQQQQKPPTDGAARTFRSAFAVDGFVRKSEIMQMRHGFAGLASGAGGGSGSARSAGNAFGQVTVLVQSRRQVVMVDADGRRVDDDQGDPTLVEVPSLCVFETSLAEPRGHWRLARIEEIGSQNKQQREDKSPQ